MHFASITIVSSIPLRYHRPLHTLVLILLILVHACCSSLMLLLAFISIVSSTLEVSSTPPHTKIDSTDKGTLTFLQFV